jgi:hypothetical protein
MHNPTIKYVLRILCMLHHITEPIAIYIYIYITSTVGHKVYMGEETNSPQNFSHKMNGKISLSNLRIHVTIHTVGPYGRLQCTR